MTASEPIPAIRPKHRWTPEEARAFSLKGHAAIASKKLVQPEPLPEPKPDRTFSALRLARVRKQLKRIDEMLLTEDDPAKLDRLAAASSKLEEQERRLSDRSLPAVRKAVLDPGPKQRRQSFVPQFEPAPAPACGVETPTGGVRTIPPDPSKPQG